VRITVAEIGSGRHGTLELGSRGAGRVYPEQTTGGGGEGSPFLALKCTGRAWRHRCAEMGEGGEEKTPLFKKEGSRTGQVTRDETGRTTPPTTLLIRRETTRKRKSEGKVNGTIGWKNKGRCSLYLRKWQWKALADSRVESGGKCGCLSRRANSG